MRTISRSRDDGKGDREKIESAQLNLAKWLEEGLAEYFSTSRIAANHLALGRIDPNTYPVWWIDEIATTPDLETNLVNGLFFSGLMGVTGFGYQVPDITDHMTPVTCPLALNQTSLLRTLSFEQF